MKKSKSKSKRDLKNFLWECEYSIASKKAVEINEKVKIIKYLKSLDGKKIVVKNPTDTYKRKESQKGHRLRVKKAMLKDGYINASDRRILEVLLFYCYPYKDTEKMANSLITKFGSLDNILKKSTKSMIKDCEITESTALLLSMINGLPKRRVMKSIENKYVTKASDIADVFVALMEGEKYEVVYIACLNANKRFVGVDMVSRGTVTEAPIYMRNIMEIALRYNSSSVILAHNHPTGEVNPSKEDIEMTEQVRSWLAGAEINVLDHLIIGDKNYYSMINNKKYSL